MCALIKRGIVSLGLLTTLHTSPPPPPRRNCSFQRQLDFSGKLSATLQLLRGDYSFTYPPLSIPWYSFIQLGELWQLGVNGIAKTSKLQQEESNPGYLDVQTTTSPPPPPPPPTCGSRVYFPRLHLRVLALVRFLRG